MTKQEYIEDISLALDVEDYEAANQFINDAYRDTQITPESYISITNFAVNRGFKFGQHYNLLEVK